MFHRSVTLISLLSLLGCGWGYSNEIPKTGVEVPQLAAFDIAVSDFMSERSIPAASLCVMKDGVVVLERGYGYRDEALTQPTRPDTIFRIASLSKPVTAACILHLASEGKLDLDARAFDVGQPGGGILPVTPFGTEDTRLKDITVQHLLDHEGGWDLNLSVDYMSVVIPIAEALGVPSPPSQEDIIRLVAGQPLDHTPGTTYAYSNFGYMVLGVIVEAVSSMDQETYVKKHIFHPTETPDREFQLGRSLPGFRDTREPFYSDPFPDEPNVFDPEENVGLPDGAVYFEGMDGAGGFITTTRAYCEFLERFWLSGDPKDNQDFRYAFFGSLPGTFTVAMQRPGNVNVVAFFNQRANIPEEESYFLISDSLDAAINSITEWPAAPPALQNQPDGAVGERPGELVGMDVYGTLSDQTARIRSRRKSIVLSLRAQVDGVTHDSNQISATRPGKRVRVGYKRGGENLAAGLLSGVYETPLSAPGESCFIKVRVRKAPHFRNRRARARVSVTLCSRKEPTARDRVRYRVRFR